jgi:hypothetical protein
MIPRRSLVALLIAVFASVAAAQECPATDAADKVAVYPSTPLNYPMTSDRYAVQYKVNGGAWTDAQVYISVYGGTNSSPTNLLQIILRFRTHRCRL